MAGILCQHKFFIFLLSYSSHSWQRGPNPPILWRPPPPQLLYYLPLPFPNFVQPPLLWCLQFPPPLLILLSCFFGWMGDHTTFDVLFYLMISWMYTCRALGPWCVFYATRCQYYWGLTHNVVFCWYSDLISHKHTHKLKDKQHTQGSVDWHTHINI